MNYRAERAARKEGVPAGHFYKKPTAIHSTLKIMGFGSGNQTIENFF